MEVVVDNGERVQDQGNAKRARLQTSRRTVVTFVIDLIVICWSVSSFVRSDVVCWRLSGFGAILSKEAVLSIVVRLVLY